MNLVWLLFTAAMVFFIQLGFTLYVISLVYCTSNNNTMIHRLESGSVKAHNVQAIMFKNMMDTMICGVVYYIVGHCIAYGNPTSLDANGFIGTQSILIDNQDWGQWFFNFAFACTASTIVSGAVAERLRLEPYFIYTIVVSAWIYPVAVHWIWSESGWLSPFNPNPALYAGAIDFAGSSVIHMLGGILGLCGAYFVGPRFRRFDESKSALSSKYHAELMHQFEFGHNVPFQVVGVMIIWFGFYGFNPGSTSSMPLASKVAVNTTLAASAGGLTSAFLTRFIEKSWHIPRLCNGILSALASITASCAVVDTGFAILIGAIGSLLYIATSKLMVKLKIDDVLDVFAVHGVGGAWGVFSAALFSTSASIKYANYPSALYDGTTVGQRILTNFVLIVVIFVWTVFHGIILFAGMKYLGILRVSEEMERSGIDQFEHGGFAVNMHKTYGMLKKSYSQSSVNDANDDKANDKQQE